MAEQKTRQFPFSMVLCATVIAMTLFTAAPVLADKGNNDSGNNGLALSQSLWHDSAQLVVTVNVHLDCGGNDNGGGHSGDHHDQVRGSSDENRNRDDLSIGSKLYYDGNGRAPGSPHFAAGTSLDHQSVKCGDNSYTLTMDDALTHDGWYTITTKATLGSSGASNTYTFDPHVEGTMGPLHHFPVR